MMRFWARVCASIALVAFLSSCADTVYSRDPYHAEFTQALIDATTEFERQVLADYVITAAEMVEALEGRTQCLEDSGYFAVDDPRIMTFSTNKYVAPGNIDREQRLHEEAFARCERGTTLLILPLYNATTRNPKNREFASWVAECLVNNGARTAPYDKSDLVAEQQTGALYADAEIDARLQQCIEDPEHIGPVEVDPNWEKPTVTKITVNPDGSYNTEPPR